MAPSPKIHSRDALKQYVLQKLGSPVVNIEITAEQLDFSVDDTLDDYFQVAYSGVVERYIPFQLLEGVHDYILPYDVFAVLNVHSVSLLGIGTGGQGAVASNMFSLNQFVAADIYKPGVARIDMLGYEMINEMIETMNIIFSSKISFDFNSITKVLHINSENISDPKIIIQVFRKLDLQGTSDPASAGRYLEENIYDERWVKRMCTARAQQQWGRNLMKYSGSVLPNGGSLNAQWIYDEGKAEVERLTQELQDMYALPIDFFLG